MNKRLIGILCLYLISAISLAAEEITVYKSPTCDCCKKWISYLEQNGFQVKPVDTDNIVAKKIEFGLTLATSSCHTAMIDGYVIEGHVPAQDIRRLLKTRPANIKGLTVPGMPVGSPGMEQGARKDPYAVLSIDQDGKTAVFAQY